MPNNTFVLKQILSGAYTLSPRRKGKSFVWNILSQVLKEDGSAVEDIVYCRSCRKVLKCAGSSTSNLFRHKCCLALKQPNPLKPVAAPDKSDALNALSKWLVGDCRPFSSVNESGFKEMVKYFIKIGSTYGEFVDVDDMIPDATAIADKCQKRVDEKESNDNMSSSIDEDDECSNLTIEDAPARQNPISRSSSVNNDLSAEVLTTERDHFKTPRDQTDRDDTFPRQMDICSEKTGLLGQRLSTQQQQHQPVKEFWAQPTSSNDDNRYDLIAKTIAMKLRGLEKRAALIAEKKINDILFEAEMGDQQSTSPMCRNNNLSTTNASRPNNNQINIKGVETINESSFWNNEQIID